MPPDQKTDTDRELGEIRKEVIESRNLVIKTDNLLKNLHAEVKAVGKRQEDFEKRQWVSSAAAYVTFAVLAVAGAVAIVGSRASSAHQEREMLEKQVADLSSQLDKQKADSNQLATAERQANEVYKLMTTLPGDERLRGIDELVKLDTSRLTPLEKLALNDRAGLLRKEIGEAALERGRAAFHKNDMNTAVSELSRFMAMNPSGDEALEASFLLGAAMHQVKKYDQAIQYLSRFVNDAKKAKTRDYAMLLLGVSYEQTGQLEKAASVIREALGTYPASEYTAGLKAHLTIVKKLMGGAEAATLSPQNQGQTQANAKTPAPGPGAEPARAPLKAAAPLPAQ